MWPSSEPANNTPGINVAAATLDDGPASFWRLLEGDDVILGPELAKGASGGTFILFGDGIASLEVASVKKRLKDKRFAATVDRGEVTAGADLLGVALDDHLAFIIDALRPHAAELGLSGRAVG